MLFLSLPLISCGQRDTTFNSNLNESNTGNQLHIKKEADNEEEYYKLIKEAKQHQQDYIDSIDDPNVKQSVQTSYSVAVAESSALYIKYPDDTDAIGAALKRVLNVE